MATGEFAAHEAHAHAAPQGFIRKWVFSLDHKVIGLQYYFLALTVVFVGMFLSLLMRIHLIGPGEGLGADLWVISIALFCIGALMSALNFITTTLDMRARGMSLMRMPLTCWAWFITAILGLLAFGVLLAAGILLILDRNAGTSFFIPLVTVNGQLAGHKGGSPLLWQHLFWFFVHPEVYIAILPAMVLF